jgi:O-antigen ligase
VRGTLGLANAYGIYLALSLIAVITLLLQPRWRVSKYFLGSVVTSIVVSSVLALNRGTWIALSAGVAVASMFYIRKIKIRWIVFCVLAVATIFSGIIVDRFRQMENKGYYEMNTLERRISYWKATLKYIPEHPVIGWGIGTTQEVMSAGDPDAANVTHNDYLRLLLETGFLGVTAYLFFLGRLAWQVLRSLRYEYLWRVNYPMLIGITYFTVISIPQNIYDHMVNLPVFLSLVAIYYRLVGFERSRIRAAERQGEASPQGQGMKTARLLTQSPFRR